jgi:hypothetical protein
MSLDDSFSREHRAMAVMESRYRPNSVLDAIKLGIWDYEPEQCEREEFVATQALPGTVEKLTVLAKRLQLGLPLWHPDDRKTFDESSIE